MAGTLDHATLAPPDALPAPSAGVNSKKPPKIPVLDGIRALAIILVLVAHMGLDKLVPGGFGVTIFFFLSGYLITTLLRVELSNTGVIDIKKFYIRRALRIFPPLYISLIILVICTALGAFPNHMRVVPVLLMFVHLTNYIPYFGYNLGNFDESVPKLTLWSLAVEEHFYLFFPFIYIFIARKMNGKRQALVLLLICAVVLGIRLICASRMSDLTLIYSLTHTRIDSILYGCILAVWSNPVLDDDRDSFIARLPHLILALAVLLLCLLIREKIGSYELFGPKAEFFRQTIRYSLQGMALFVIFNYLIRLSDGPLRALLVNKPMKIIGLLSYTVYLVNNYILEFVYARFPQVFNPLIRHVITDVIGLTITFGYAWLMYLLVEQPLARRRSKLH